MVEKDTKMIQAHVKPKSKPRKVVQGAAAFSKSISILQMIADSTEPPSIAQLVKESGMPRPTLHRLLKALAAEDMVESRPNKTSALGARMIQLAGRALEQNDLVRIAAPELDWLCAKTHETIHLAIRAGQDLVCIHKKDTSHPVRIASSVGGSVPFHASAIGKCLLAYLPDDEQAEIIDCLELRNLTEYTITTKEKLMEELRAIRDVGYSIAHQESDLEVECYGVCVFDRANRPIAGISISVPLYRLNSNRSMYVNPLLECRDRIHSKMGTGT